MNKKLLLIPTVLVVGVGVVLAQNHAAPQSPSVKYLSSQATTTQATTQPTTQGTATTQPPASGVATAPVSQPTTQPAQTTPAFGQDPSNPGQYIVYDKASVMNDAGIPAGQQADAGAAIARVSNWSYGNFLTLCKRGAGPSSMSTGTIRSSQASFGPSVYTDAVVQLKWCVQWMNDNNLTWQTL